MIRVIIADDHQMFTDGISAILTMIDSAEVVTTATDGVDLIDKLSKHEADLILMDYNMPKMNGLEATKKVLHDYPDIKVLMLTMHDSTDVIQKILKAGAHGYLLKNTGKEELEEAMVTVMSGESYFSAEVSKRIMEAMQGKKPQRSQDQLVELTERETDVLKLIAQEMTTNEIAEKLFISHHTVETHRKNLISKLGARNTVGLVKYAVQKGIVE